MTGPDDGLTAATPRARPAARLLILDPADRVLLFRVEDASFRDPVLWLTPGGGLEGDETYEQAAIRELTEETGIDAPLGPCVWVRRHTFAFQGRWYDQCERFFVVRAPSATTSSERWTDIERDVIKAHRWWSLDELARSDPASDGVFVPRRLAELLPPILAGRYPAEPVDTGV